MEKDKAILQTTGQMLRNKGFRVEFVHERHLDRVDADLCLSMARSPHALQVLRESGAACVNTPEGVALCCHRARLDRLMRSAGIAMPPLRGSDGWWLKRGDGAAQQKDDVVFCADDAILAAEQQRMRERGISEQVVSAHVVGDLVKFYGVLGTSFFCCFYPTDDDITKFGNEQYNGEARHYVFDTSLLQSEAGRLAQLTGVKVYGGDCVVRPDGSLAIIDFNDWPSFSRCRAEAAAAIASLAESKL